MPDTTPPPPLPQPADPQYLHPSNEPLIRQIQSGGSWLFWIAGLSLVNLVLGFTGNPLRFAVGLTFTELVLGVGMAFAPIGTIVASCMNVALLGAFGGMGWFARKGALWALIIGVAVMAADSLLTVVLLQGEGVLSIVIHVVAIYFLVNAIIATNKMNRRRAKGFA
jgi:hypothetical protein